MTDRQKVLVVEDDPEMRKFLMAGLEAHGYTIFDAVTGCDGVAATLARRPDVLLLDLGLPDMDGTAVVSEIRQWSAVPIVVLSCRTATADKIDALDRGADDYVTKPFDLGELLARIRAALRHAHRQGSQPVFVSGALKVDLVRRLVFRDGHPVRLTPREFALLRLLALNPDKVLTHPTILKEVWGPAHIHDTHYLRIFVGRLRQKLEDEPACPRILVTEAGVGYRLRTLPPSSSAPAV